MRGKDTMVARCPTNAKKKEMFYKMNLSLFVLSHLTKIIKEGNHVTR